MRSPTPTHVEQFQFYAPVWRRDHLGPFRFLALPTEIRNLVYEEAFAEDYSWQDQIWPPRSNPIHFPGTQGSHHTISGRGPYNKRVKSPHKFFLAFTSKQVYSEARPVVYKIHRFVISIIGDVEVCYPDQFTFSSFHRRLYRAPDTTLAFIRHLELFICDLMMNEDGCNPGQDLSCLDLLEAIGIFGKGLRTLRIQIPKLPSLLGMPSGCKRTHGQRILGAKVVRSLHKLARQVPCLELEFGVFDAHCTRLLNEIPPPVFWTQRPGSDETGEMKAEDGETTICALGASFT